MKRVLPLVLLAALLAALAAGLLARREAEQERRLVRACRDGDIRLVQALVRERGSRVASRTEAGLTPLHTAVDAFQEDAVEFLLEHGADPNALGSGSLAPLHCAAQRNYRRLAELLLARGARVDEPDLDGWTALHWAAFLGHDRLAALLVGRGADVHRRDALGRSPLDYAILLGPPELEDLLSPGSAGRRGVRLDGVHRLAATASRTALQQALERDPSRLLAVDGYGWNVFDHAFRRGHLYVGLNIAEGQPMDLGVNHRGPLGLTVPHLVILQQSEMALTRFLNRGGTNLEAPDQDGRTPLHWALKLRNARLAQRLLRAGVDFQGEDARGQTPLSLARLYHLADVARDLESRGARD